jgi:hypothetical protein
MKNSHKYPSFGEDEKTNSEHWISDWEPGLAGSQSMIFNEL